MIETALNRCLNRFLNEIENFTYSGDSSAIIYNTDKLSKVVKDKQLMDVCKIDQETLDIFYTIGSGLGKLVSQILLQVTPNMIKSYNAFEKEIENSFSGDFFLFAKQAALSVKSLYYYKIKDFKKATAITLECIALNEYLIQRGIHVLIHRCIEQNKNIARIYFRECQYEQGYILMRNIFSYLLNGNTKGLHGNLYKNKHYWEETPALREYYTYEIFVMTVQDVLIMNSKNTNFLPDTWYANLEFDVNTLDRQIIYNWIYINNQLRGQNYNEYIESLIYYLKEPISLTYDILKICLVRDILHLVGNSEFKEKKQFLEKMKRYSEIKIKSYENYNGMLPFYSYCA